MSDTELASIQQRAVDLAVVSFPLEQIFEGQISNGLPSSDEFPGWVEHFEKFDDGIRKRLSGKGPVAVHVIGDHICWFAGESVVDLIDVLRELHGLGGKFRGTNYLTLSEISVHIQPTAQHCAGQLCLALTDLSRTRQFQPDVENVYGCKEIEALGKRISPALDHFNVGMRGVEAVVGQVQRDGLSSQEIVQALEKKKLLNLWELLEIAIPRMKENDKGPLMQIMQQLVQPGDQSKIPDANMSEGSEQGFIFRVRHLLSKRLSNQDRAFLSETRSALVQSRREFLTITAFVATYHQMVLAPRAYEEAGAAVQFALLSKQRRYASRACRELDDHSPKDLTNLGQAEAAAAEAEGKLDPDRILKELKESGQVTPPKAFEATGRKAEAEPEAKPVGETAAAEPKKKPRSGMHFRR